MTAILWTSFYWAWVASEVVIAVATRTGKSGGKIRELGKAAGKYAIVGHS